MTFSLLNEFILIHSDINFEINLRRYFMNILCGISPFILTSSDFFYRQINDFKICTESKLFKEYFTVKFYLFDNWSSLFKL